MNPHHIFPWCRLDILRQDCAAKTARPSSQRQEKILRRWAKNFCATLLWTGESSVSSSAKPPIPVLLLPTRSQSQTLKTIQLKAIQNDNSSHQPLLNVTNSQLSLIIFDKNPFNIRSTSIKPPFNHHSTTIWEFP